MVLDRLQSFFVFPVHHVSADGITGPLPIDDTDDSSAAASASHCYYCCCSREAEAVEPTTQVCATEPNTQAEAATTSVTAAIGNARPSGALALQTGEDHKSEAEEEPESEQEQDHESITLDEAYALAQRHCVLPAPAAAASTAAAAKATPTDQRTTRRSQRRWRWRTGGGCQKQGRRLRGRRSSTRAQSCSSGSSGRTSSCRGSTPEAAEAQLHPQAHPRPRLPNSGAVVAGVAAACRQSTRPQCVHVLVCCSFVEQTDGHIRCADTHNLRISIHV